MCEVSDDNDLQRQLAAWERLQERASRGDRQKFLDVLGKVPDVEPDEHDRL